jgi:hypothetical protein
MLTKKELLKVLEPFPDDAPIKIYRGAFYVDVDFVQLKKLWDCGKQVESICIETKILKEK